MKSNHYIIKTRKEGIKVLTFHDLKSELFSLQQFHDNKDGGSYTDSLGILASDSHVIIAATQNDKVGERFTRSV